METRKDAFTTLKLCRFCLSQDETLTSIYDRNRAPKNSVPLPLKILSCVSIEVFPSDRMPSYICNRCKFFMDISYEYKQMCRQADENVLQYIQNGTDLNSVSWPSSLQKLYRVASKSAPELAVMKTVVEGGATVQVTAHGSDSEEEDDESVYNVKIGDGSEGPKNARVKVVTANKQNKGKPKPDKGFLQVSKLTRHVREHAGDRSYPCKYCSKSFVKSHHYTRHLRVKHREAIRTCRGPFGASPDRYRCEQCDDMFSSQDELIYHSAIHATQNLTCPLCQEKFEDVDAVTAHIKSHVNGTEFMCDLCELVFTTKEKLDSHINNAHEDELRGEETGQEESSPEMEVEDDEDDATINLKEEDDHMVVEIKKPDDFMISQTDELKGDGDDNSNSEESDSEMTFTELSTVDTLAMTRKETGKPTLEKPVVATLGGAIITKTVAVAPKPIEKDSTQTAQILRKAEEVKRKVPPIVEPVAEKKNTKTESNNIGASDKSLRLLEKELQELKRTNTREIVKTPAKPAELLRNRRPQIHTSTPKLKVPAVEEKKTQLLTKSAVEKKQPERRIITKENKEPKEAKEMKGNNGNTKEEKEVKEKEKEVKEKETPKNVVKNGTNEKSVPEDGIRRSTRPSKIKDYAKMIRDRAQDTDDDDYSEADEEYKETERSVEKTKARRASIKPSPKQAVETAGAIAIAAPRKRGRPRKNISSAPSPAKMKKDSEEAKSDDAEKESENDNKPRDNALPAQKGATTDSDKTIKSAPELKPALGASILMSPTGQTLKKIPIKALPPGVKPLPLPANARPMAGGEVCEMQIGKKVVKVQKIVMTKAEVEAMAKKGLVEMKDGTMVLKQGIKLPTSDPAALKNLVGDELATKESPSKTDKAAPSRCDMGEET